VFLGTGADGSLGVHVWPGGNAKWTFDDWPVVKVAPPGTWRARNDTTYRAPISSGQRGWSTMRTVGILAVYFTTTVVGATGLALAVTAAVNALT
jgi:hypothetical protein